MSDFNFKWYTGKKKKSRKEYQHDYYINVTKPKRQRKGIRNDKRKSLNACIKDN